ncbi:hypothetical protein LCGC14_2775270 [marine sediment metagenome]|uniref:Uncharacterized protein n=1 Tax=marine sediment metagenome TaxID=412755 RepID=A0A0F9BLF6_9ZZZZ
MASILGELDKQAAERAALPLKTFVVRTIGKPKEVLESFQCHEVYRGVQDDAISIHQHGIGTVAFVRLQPGQVLVEEVRDVRER